MFQCLRSVTWILIACAAIAGCSRSVFESNLNPHEAGLAYYLPKSLLTITATAVGYPKGMTVKELTEKEHQIAKVEGTVTVRTRLGGVMRDLVVNDKGELARPKLIALELKPVEPDIVADAPYKYILQYQPRIDYSDRVCAGVTDKSLLQFIEAATKDETGNILISVGKLAGRFATPEAFSATGVAKALSRTLKMQIDPFKRDDVRDFNRALWARFPELGRQFSLQIEGLERFGEPHSPAACPQDRVCYRTEVPVRIGLSQHGRKIVAQQYTKVVNRASVHTIDIERAFLVEKLTRLGFRDGVLDYAIIKKPSEVLAAAQLPLTIYDAVLTSALAAPGHFLDQITPGTSAVDVSSILQNLQSAVNATESLHGELAAIRNDHIKVTPEDGTSKFKLNCKTRDPQI